MKKLDDLDTALAPIPGFLSTFGGPARLVSVDGCHEAEEVDQNLTLTSGIFSPHGIVAIDDNLNSPVLGVGGGTPRFLAAHGDLIPFALFENTLFAWRLPSGDEYQASIHRFLHLCDFPDRGVCRQSIVLNQERVDKTLHEYAVSLM